MTTATESPVGAPASTAGSARVAVAVLAGGAAAAGVSAGSFAGAGVVAVPGVSDVVLAPVADLAAPDAVPLPAFSVFAVFVAFDPAEDRAAPVRPAPVLPPADLAAGLLSAPAADLAADALSDLPVDLVDFAPDFPAVVLGLLADVSPSCGWLTVELLERDS